MIFLTLTLSKTSFYIFSYFENERNFIQLKNYLESCGELVLAKLIQNSAYSGNEVIKIDNFNCYVGQINGSNIKQFRLKGILGNQILFLNIIFDTSSLNINLWNFGS